MKKLLSFVLIIVSIQTWGQHYTMQYVDTKQNIGKEIPVLASMFVAGIAEGNMDYLQFHYDGNNQFWQPNISWTNKYHHHNPSEGLTFKGKYFVFLTDGWHMEKAINHTAVLCALTFKLSGNVKKKWYWYVLEAATYYTANRAGFYIGYNIIKIK